MDRDLKRLRWQELPQKLRGNYKEILFKTYYIKITTITPGLTFDLFSTRKYENITCYSSYDVVYIFKFNIDTLETELNFFHLGRMNENQLNKLIEKEASVILDILRNHFSPNNSINFIKDL